MSKTNGIPKRAEKHDLCAAEAILPLVYEELRKLAAQRMAREAPGQTLQATALVHEAWLRLGGSEPGRWRNQAHFFAAAAEAMRWILIDHARRKRAVRHGGGMERLDLDGLDLAANMDSEEVLALHEALDRLAAHDRSKAELVKLRFFAGLTLQEAAQVLEISGATAKRHNLGFGCKTQPYYAHRIRAANWMLK